MYRYQHEKWTRTRNRGALRFVIIHGVLLWGCSVGLLSWLLNSFLEFQQDPSVSWSELLEMLPILLGCFAVGGILGGTYTYSNYERKYYAHERELAKNGDSQ
ncbi:MAG TPA: hypothetical protein EYO84_02700 [Planctomycetes bacterium]|nr:hypothetical protein [Planctomycetota bacterium]